jgi:hypothetical protein
MYEVRIFDGKGKLKRVVPKEEVQEMYWNNADFGYDLLDLESPVVTARSMQGHGRGNPYKGKRVPRIKITCAYCKIEKLVVNWNQIACSAECKVKFDKQRKKEARKVMNKICKVCGLPFSTTYSQTIYCQSPCTVKDWRKKIKYYSKVKK